MVQVTDVRSLSPEGQEALRKRAVQAVLGGMKQTTVARTLLDVVKEKTGTT